MAAAAMTIEEPAEVACSSEQTKQLTVDGPAADAAPEAAQQDSDDGSDSSSPMSPPCADGGAEDPQEAGAPPTPPRTDEGAEAAAPPPAEDAHTTLEAAEKPQEPQAPQQPPVQQQMHGEAADDQEAHMDSASKRAAPDDAEPSEQPEPKRARPETPPSMSLGEASERLLAAAELARNALVDEEPTAAQGADMSATPVSDLEAACEDAKKRLRAAEAQWRMEQASLIAAKTNLLSLRAAQERASQAQQKTSPLIDELRRVAAEVSEVCDSTAKAAAAVAAKDGADEMAKAASAMREQRLDSACKHLNEARSRMASLIEERSSAEASREEAKAKLAVLEQQREEAQRRAAVEEAARVAEADAERLQKEALELEAEIALLQVPGEKEGSGAELAAAGAAPVADGEEAKDEKSSAGEPQAPPTASGADGQEAKCLSVLKRRVDELQQACEDEATAIAELEARCATAAPGAAVTAAAKAKAAGGESGTDVPALDLAKPGAFLAARAAQRLFVSTEDAPDVAGEYRLLPTGANGCPAYKASGPRPTFLLWTACEGGCWVFSPDLDGTGAVFARSLQLAWTALPDEIMAGSWTRAAWGERGTRARIAVLRG